jgi:hypothetical protein
MMHVERNEAHIILCDNGHLLSTDCWCEPVAIKWLTNKNGVRVLVVEHVDETFLPHLEVIRARDIADDILTRDLNHEVPKPFFPQDPDERKI